LCLTPNQRLSTRIPFRKRVKYGLGDSTSVGYTFNLSENGIGIEANRVFSPRSNIAIQMYVSGDDLEESSMDEIVRVEGTVAWTSPALPGMLPAMGIKFSSGSNEIKRMFQQRIKQ
jgi:PilZ domain-containing protein